MKLSVAIGYMTARDRPADAATLTQHAEALGFDTVWASEAYGSDAVSVLGYLAGRTEKINIGSAVLQIPGRTPAMTAMTASGLDAVSDGRFRLGLGVSGPQVVEGWHGQPFAKPLARTREYVGLVRQALSGEIVRSDGPHYPLPLPGGAGKPLKLMARPVADRVPIYLAAVGPKNLELTGEIADGWQGLFYAPDQSAETTEALARGREKSGRSADDFDAMVSVGLAAGDDLTTCADALRPWVALYIGGMGSRKHNFYNALAVRMGYADEAAEIQDLYLAGDQRAAARAVPSELIERVSLLGDQTRLRDQLTAFADSGITQVAVMPQARSLPAKLEQLDAIAAAHAETSAPGV
ncbi:LLM class F420-dependent oxidoreductase [Naumannella halotolerans]|uniref:F420-dependent oxidoreductase-like protein n=1 Tax=Naumannella halotolerans TaxID=993414 RepID=A0A4R7J994_9ACTN|nr:LLM class F420-dependent oxidoreductase [Naumannella halotolerans]TDT33063.1 F420-dependent oxidoreductase-like protein [Naumannella halotolerans]